MCIMQSRTRPILATLGLALAACLLLASNAFAAGVTVTVTNPANNATVPLTFNVAASATTGNVGASVTGWHIYLNNVSVFGTPGPTSSINTNVTASSPGTYTMVVRAWDSTGAFGDQTLTITAVPASGVTVTVSSPADGAAVPTSLDFVASATTTNSGASITGWHIYVDSNDAFGTPGPTTSIYAPVSMSAGTHTVIVRAWDSTGAFGDQTLSVTAGACSGICVTVTSPTLTGPATSPVQFTASAADGAGHTITGYVVYSDDQNVFQNNNSTTLNASVSLPQGNHQVFVRAWDSTGAFGSSPTFTLTVSGTGGGGTIAGHHHVVVVAFENHSYEAVVGSSATPYYNNTLIAKHGLATQFYANAHDSLSQYFFLIDGTSNCAGAGTCGGNPTNLVATADSVIREVINSGQTWKQYTDSLPSRGFIVEEPDFIAGSNPPGNYYSRHAPAVYLSDVRQGTPTTQAVDCSAAPNGYDSTTQACNVVNFADANNGFQHDLGAGTLPNFSLVIPNGCDDAHDGGSCLTTADSWLQANIDPLLNSSYFQPGGDGLLIIWWDEGSLSGLTDSCGTNIADNRSSSTSCSGGGGRIPVVVAASDLKGPGFQSSVFYQHPSVTKTICEALGIPTPSPAAGATDLADFF
jgi:Phosphoesterase family